MQLLRCFRRNRMVLQSDCNATVGGLSQQLKNARESKLNIVIPMVFHCKTVAAFTSTSTAIHIHKTVVLIPWKSPIFWLCDTWTWCWVGWLWVDSSPSIFCLARVLCEWINFKREGGSRVSFNFTRIVTLSVTYQSPLKLISSTSSTSNSEDIRFIPCPGRVFGCW